MNDVVDRQFIVWRDRAEAAEAKLAAALIRIEALEVALEVIAETANYLGNGEGVVAALEKIARAALVNQQPARD